MPRQMDADAGHLLERYRIRWKREWIQDDGMGSADFDTSASSDTGIAKYRYVGKATGWYVEEDRYENGGRPTSIGFTDASNGIFTADVCMGSHVLGEVIGANSNGTGPATHALAPWEVDLLSGKFNAKIEDLLRLGWRRSARGMILFVYSRNNGGNLPRTQFAGVSEAPPAFNRRLLQRRRKRRFSI